MPSPDLPPPPPPGQPWEVGEPAENERRWRESAKAWKERSLERVNHNRRRLGLEPVHDVHAHLRTDQPWLAADPTLAPRPTTHGWTCSRLGHGFWLTLSRCRARLRRSSAPVYLGFGSMPATETTSRLLVESASVFGRRAILGRGWAELDLIVDGPECIAVGDVKHEALFPRVVAVVHHGGAGNHHHRRPRRGAAGDRPDVSPTSSTGHTASAHSGLGRRLRAARSPLTHSLLRCSTCCVARSATRRLPRLRSSRAMARRSLPSAWSSWRRGNDGTAPAEVEATHTDRERRIGELVEAIGLTARALRHYEQIGLLDASAPHRRRAPGPRAKGTQVAGDLKAGR